MRMEIRSRETAFSTPWFDVIAKRVGEPGSDESEVHYVVQPPDYVTVLAVTADGRIPMVRQYRPAPEREMLELPSGHVDPGESPEAAARRELHEETGYRASRLRLLGRLVPDSGRLGNHLWCYQAMDVYPDGDGDWQPEPGVVVVHRPAADIAEMAADGRLEHAHDLAAVALAVSQKELGDLCR